MKRINFREVTEKLNELKQAESRAKDDYLLSDFHNEDEILSCLELYNARSDLERLRNTKISDLHYLFN